ncbi:MAG: hypothetical protein M1533_02920 [Candidatus Thermoplasmatota archaeon]|jgi:DNA polymerase elongation subunit (family B)|nr:hypothetical protein [Candidatus Thermoplasmatota archaeon]MCL5793629.1 hypothetical protein [Candidatus Thermoplasmatota archaeon]
MGNGYNATVQSILDFAGADKVLSFDLETLVADSGGFLNNERIIAISASYGFPEINDRIFISKKYPESDEINLLRDFDTLLKEVSPEIIIGYNHSGYDIPLIQKKLRSLTIQERLRNIEYYFATSYCLDMMYVIADDLKEKTGEYIIRKLDNVVTHKAYSHLDLRRVKDRVFLPGLNKGESIKKLWLEDKGKLIEYALGDSHDILVIFNDIFGSKSS